jgi:recA bacterial DNA recombination protein
MALARADLESLLRARRLDRTLTTALPPVDPHDDAALAPSGVPSLDARLGGGLRRGHVSEIVGARSSGRTSLLLQTLAASTTRGELVALVDALDMFDVESAAAAGIDLDRLLWIRGHVVTNPGLCGDMNQRALEQAIRAFTLVLQAGNFGLVVLDVAEAPTQAIRRLPFTTWMRVQRMVEGSQTACLLVGSEPMARSSAGLTLRLANRGLGIGDWGLGGLGGLEKRGLEKRALGGLGDGEGPGIRFGNALFDGLTVDACIVRARARDRDESSVTLSTRAADCA